MIDTNTPADAAIPLVSDLDDTLLRTDTLCEGVVAHLAEQPLAIFRFPGWLRLGKPAFKARLAKSAAENLAVYPVNEVVLAQLEQAARQGRPLYLATASRREVAEAAAARFGLFTEVFATEGAVNLKGQAKAELLVAKFGDKGFDYIGDSLADVPVWRVARRAFCVAADEQTRQAALAANADCQMLWRPAPSFTDYRRALRMQQWVKNLLVFAPMILAHAFNFAAFFYSLIAFIGFCCCASAIYIVNDLSDLASDRRHPSKQRRPFACGAVPLRRAAPLFSGCAALALLTCCFLPGRYALLLAGYFLLTVGYTARLKKMLFIDVVVLASLYVLRILGGAAALGGATSNWLLAFGIFIFTGLALLKRTGDLIQHEAVGLLPGRAYRFADKTILEMMAVCSGFSAIVIAALYIDSLKAENLYRHPLALWLTCPLLLYWYGRLLIITNRGEMGDDPVYFTIRDRASRYCLLAVLLIMLVAM
ncbi:MAG: UbiA family prenyltransferase [Desulfobulbaceae bacterium]|nr:UbiA family prenyltransferase [Desulfobulbaceae bacterium]